MFVDLQLLILRIVESNIISGWQYNRLITIELAGDGLDCFEVGADETVGGGGGCGSNAGDAILQVSMKSVSESQSVMSVASKSQS